MLDGTASAINNSAYARVDGASTLTLKSAINNTGAIGSNLLVDAGGVTLEAAGRYSSTSIR